MVGTDAERAQKGPSLAGAEVDTAGNQGGVNRMTSLAVAVAVGREALHIALGVVADLVHVVADVVAVRVVREGAALLADLLLFLVLRAVGIRQVLVHQHTCLSLAQLLLALVREVTSQDKRRQTALTAFQKLSRC